MDNISQLETSEKLYTEAFKGLLKLRERNLIKDEVWNEIIKLTYGIESAICYIEYVLKERMISLEESLTMVQDCSKVESTGVHVNKS